MQMDYEKLSGLCTAFQNGDEQAFAQLYEAMYGPMRGFALIRLAHDAHAAEDAVQDAFIEIYRGIGGLKDPQAFPKWANTILARMCAKKAAKEGREALLDEEAEGLFDNIPYDEEEFLPGSVLEREQSCQLILEIMDELPDLHREALTLRYLGDMPIAEMAAALEVPEGTVKSRLNHAKRAMRQRVEAMQEKGVVFGVAPVFVLSQVLQDGAAAHAGAGLAEVWAAVAAKTGCTAILGGTAAAAAQAAAEAAATTATTTASTTATATTAATATAVTAKAAGAAISGKAMALILAGTLAVGGVGVGVGVTVERQQEARPAISAPAEHESSDPSQGSHSALGALFEGFSQDTPDEDTPDTKAWPKGVVGNTAHNIAAGGGIVQGENGVFYAYGCFLNAAREKEGENHPLARGGFWSEEEAVMIQEIRDGVGIYELRPDKSARLLTKVASREEWNLNYYDGQIYFSEYDAIYRLDPVSGQRTELYKEQDRRVYDLLILDGTAYWINGDEIYRAPLEDFVPEKLYERDGLVSMSYYEGIFYLRLDGELIDLRSFDPHSGEERLLAEGLPMYWVLGGSGWPEEERYISAEDGYLHVHGLGVSDVPEGQTHAFCLASGELEETAYNNAPEHRAGGLRYTTRKNLMYVYYNDVTWPDGTVERYYW